MAGNLQKTAVTHDGTTANIYVNGALVRSDVCVNRVRWALQNDLSATAPDNTGDVRLVAQSTDAHGRVRKTVTRYLG